MPYPVSESFMSIILCHNYHEGGSNVIPFYRNLRPKGSTLLKASQLVHEGAKI